jgi:hypothetical protein
MRSQDRSERGTIAPDQHCLGDARKIRRQRGDAAGFGNAAGNPDKPVIAGQGAGGRIRVGRLAVIDEPNAAQCRNQFLAMGQARKADDPGGDLCAGQAH